MTTYTYTTFDPTPGSSIHGPESINSSGQVTGSIDDSTGDHGFIYSRDTSTILDDPQSALGQTYAYIINASRQVVGYYADNNQVAHGFLYSAGVFSTNLRARRIEEILLVDPRIERRSHDQERMLVSERGDEAARHEGNEIAARRDPQRLQIARHGERDAPLHALLVQPFIDHVLAPALADNGDVARLEKRRKLPQTIAELTAPHREHVGIRVEPLPMKAWKGIGRAGEHDVERALEFRRQAGGARPGDEVEPDARRLRGDPRHAVHEAIWHSPW